MAGVPPCIPCLFGARNLGRVLFANPATVPGSRNQRISKISHSAEYKSPLGLLVHWLVSLLVYIFLDPGTVAGFAKQLDIYIYIYIYATVPLARLACGFNCCSGIPIRNPFTAILFFFGKTNPEKHPEKQSGKTYPEFRKELTESQFFQRSRYSGNPENAPLSSESSVLSPNVNKHRGGSLSSRRVAPPGRHPKYHIFFLCFFACVL